MGVSPSDGSHLLQDNTRKFQLLDFVHLDLLQGKQRILQLNPNRTSNDSDTDEDFMLKLNTLEVKRPSGAKRIGWEQLTSPRRIMEPRAQLAGELSDEEEEQPLKVHESALLEPESHLIKEEDAVKQERSIEETNKFEEAGQQQVDEKLEDGLDLKRRSVDELHVTGGGLPKTEADEHSKPLYRVEQMLNIQIHSDDSRRAKQYQRLLPVVDEETSTSSSDTDTQSSKIETDSDDDFKLDRNPFEEVKMHNETISLPNKSNLRKKVRQTLQIRLG